MALCALAVVAEPLAPEPAPSIPPFKPASKYALQYGVEWRMIRAGLARVTWDSLPQGGHQAEVHLESVGLVSKLHRVNDDYRAILAEDSCGKSVLFKAEEGNRRRETRVTFDRDAGKTTYLERDLIKTDVVIAKELQTPPCVFEHLGALHRIRGLRLEPGQSTTLPVTDGKKFANVKVDAQEREQIRTPTGTYSTIRYEVHMFNDVIIPKKARMFMWVSDDSRRLPVQLRLRMQFLIGTITLQLEKEEHW